MSDFSLMSLMDLASVDTSDIAAQTSRLPKQGIYIINLDELKFTEQAATDPADPSNYNLNIKGTILTFSPLNESDSAEGMEGRPLNERYFLYGKDVKEAIALLMGRFKVAGFKHKGVMGGVEGGPAGWVEDAVNNRVAVRVSHYTVKKTGQENARIDWLSPKAMEKAGIPWEVMQRDFLDEHGNVQEAA